ncbi:hypothetical protein HNY73_021517 [Argiope bruennichi]|uniref:Uncharacterized protein n=1 Tax=Argiope bruennichi TaxID=94029 RepID=A0A8T0DXW8_ARGBR|nr:hypothetical protein HNY73_021517 [Argiope bruennichi]
MSPSEHVQTVRAVLESLPPPENIPLYEEKEKLGHKIVDQVKEIVTTRRWVIPDFNNFITLDASVYREEFQELVKGPHALP